MRGGVRSSTTSVTATAWRAPCSVSDASVSPKSLSSGSASKTTFRRRYGPPSGGRVVRRRECDRRVPIGALAAPAARLFERLLERVLEVELPGAVARGLDVGEVRGQHRVALLVEGERTRQALDRRVEDNARHGFLSFRPASRPAAHPAGGTRPACCAASGC